MWIDKTIFVYEPAAQSPSEKCVGCASLSYNNTVHYMISKQKGTPTAVLDQQRRVYEERSLYLRPCLRRRSRRPRLSR